MPHSVRSTGLPIFFSSRLTSKLSARSPFSTNGPRSIRQRRIIAPFVRITNLHLKRGEFLERLCLVGSSIHRAS